MKKKIKFILRKFFYGFLQYFLTDLWYAKIRYWLEMDEWPNLRDPQKFTEKIQHIKLFEQTEKRKMAANRLAVRSYVKGKIGAKHLIPLIGSYDSLSKETWDDLPSSFILKANHGCGMLRIIRNKDDHLFSNVKSETEEWQETDYYKKGREWAYKGLERVILAEKLLLNEKGKIPKDYKFFCFNGKVKVIQIDYNRFGEQRRNLFDHSFNPIDGKLLYPTYKEKVRKPDNLERAIGLAEKLSASFNFIRVDLYLLNDSIYFGELTNYPGNGFIPFQPEELEKKIGNLLTL